MGICIEFLSTTKKGDAFIVALVGFWGGFVFVFPENVSENILKNQELYLVGKNLSCVFTLSGFSTCVDSVPMCGVLHSIFL